MKKEFWRDWKRVTKLEKDAIKVLKFAKKLILKNIPKKDIVAIYVKGSFPRREMNKWSDIDPTVILRTNRNIKKVKKLAKKYKKKLKPELNLGALSLWELKNNKHFYKSKKPRGSPYLFIRKVKDFKLICGKKINPEDYPKREDKEFLKKRIKTFYNLFIPMYKEKKPLDIGFSGLLKQVFWIVELEEQVKGNNPPASWKKLAKSIKDKNHIIHDTLKYRLKKTKDKKLRRAYINKLKRYLKKLEKLT
jgi:predicted nucleotidyltransferase